MAVRVRHAVGRAEALIDALLTLAVSDQGTTSSEFVDLATCAEDAIDTAAADAERLGLRVEATLDPAETSGDAQLLERMVGNLVDNAVWHNQPGGWVRLRTGTADGAVFLHVVNSGPVIPDDVVPTLFEPFRRMERVGDRRGPAGDRTGPAGDRDGVGLGLSIAQSVVAAHGATVSARSRPGGGLDISVVMPRNRSVRDG